jgi:hypothetical protein
MIDVLMRAKPDAEIEFFSWRNSRLDFKEHLARSTQTGD